MNEETVIVKCPYCSYVQTDVGQTDLGRNIILCDCDEGGCDKYYAYSIRKTVELNVFKMEDKGTLDKEHHN